MGRTRKVTTQEVFDGDEDAQNDVEDVNADVALFDFSDVNEKKITALHVFRIDPNEGYLGTLDPSATEADIAGKWGGGQFRVQAKNEKSKIVAGKQTTIAGDPIFVSEAFERRWRRMNGLRDERSNDAGVGMNQLFTVMMTMQERSEARAQQAAEDRRRDEERREQQRREDLQREETRRREDERERERLRLEEQRRRDEMERQDRERSREAAQQQLQQTQQFMATMTGVLTAQLQAAQQAATTALTSKPATDPVAVLMQGIELAVKLRPEGGEGKGEEGGGNDPIAALISKIPEMISEARETALAFRGQQQPAEEAEDGESGEEAAERMVIEGPTAARFKQVAAKLVREGKDPEKVLNAVAEAILRARPALPPRPAAPPAAPPAPHEAQASAPAPSPAPRPAVPPPPAPSRTAAILVAQARARAARAAAMRAAPKPATTPTTPTTPTTSTEAA